MLRRWHFVPREWRSAVAARRVRQIIGVISVSRRNLVANAAILHRVNVWVESNTWLAGVPLQEVFTVDI